MIWCFVACVCLVVDYSLLLLAPAGSFVFCSVLLSFVFALIWLDLLFVCCGVALLGFVLFSYCDLFAS